EVSLDRLSTSRTGRSSEASKQHRVATEDVIQMSATKLVVTTAAAALICAAAPIDLVGPGGVGQHGASAGLALTLATAQARPMRGGGAPAAGPSRSMSAPSGGGMAPSSHSAGSMGNPGGGGPAASNGQSSNFRSGSTQPSNSRASGGWPANSTANGFGAGN